MDIENYNYLELLFRDYRSGKIAAEVSQSKDKKKVSKTGELT